MGNVARRPDGRWRARYRGPDKRERSRHFDRKLDAERWLAAVEVAKARGEWIDPKLSRVTVGSWATTWLDTQSQLKATTRARYEGIVKLQIKPTWERVALGDVTPADVAAWLRRLTETGLSAATVRYAHRVLSLMLRWAVLDGRISRNPAEGVPLPRAKARAKRYLTHAEVSALADECGDEHRTLILTLAYTGLRWGEAAALEVGDVDLMRRRIHVRRAMAEVAGRAVVGSPKTHEQRQVPIPRFLADLLTQTCAGRRQSELLFAGERGGYLRNGNFRRRVFDGAVDRAGLDGITPHGLRHTAASLAIASGASVVVVSRMLGHADPSITLRVYSHLFPDDLDALADRLGDARESAAVADQLRTAGTVVALPEPRKEAADAI